MEEMTVANRKQIGCGVKSVFKEEISGFAVN
jgi:hypothetical protein